MSASSVPLAWRPTITGQLLLLIGSSGAPVEACCIAVPPGVVRALVTVGGVDMTDDPAGDMIRAEGRWRLRAAHLEDTTVQLYRAAVTAFADLHALPPTATGPCDGVLGDGERHRLSALLHAAVDQFAASCRALTVARNRILALRGFVTCLDVPFGFLAGARAGWLRGPARPAHVSTYADENAFVTADPRRAAAGATRDALSSVGLVAGEVFGVGWRRDGDDDDPYTDEPAGLGPWQLGDIPATGEIYATRRCHYRDPQVWLLARGHTHPGCTRQLLSRLKRRMGEPNSLLLAAEVVRGKPDTSSSTDTRWDTSAGGHCAGEATGGSAAPDGWAGPSEPGRR